MSTHSYIPEVRQGIGRLAFSILGGLLLAFPLILSPVTFASSSRGNVDPPQAQAQSEVAVVRLVIDYTPKSSSTTTNIVLCTSLGVLVKSWPARTPTDLNSWILTGSNVLTTPTPCGPANATGKPATTYTLSKIDVYANSNYTGNTLGNAFLGTYFTVPSNPLVCSTPCSGGVDLFAFHTNQPQPTLDVATTDITQRFGILLTNGASTTTLPPLPVPSTAVAQQFLVPTAVALGSTSTQQEVGVPLLNTQGQLVAMRLQGTALFTSANYQAFVAQRALFKNTPPNPLQVAWENGITAYYAHNYRDAVTSFAQVETLNPNLQAATSFKMEATAQLNSSQGNPAGKSSVTSAASTSLFGIPRSTFLIIGIVAGFLLLIILLIIVSMWARHRHELARFEKERVEAQRNAEREVQQMQQSKATAQLQYPVTELPCPNCGTLVQTTEAFCPHCRYLLSASTSGLHLQAIPPPPVAPQPQANYIQPSNPPVPTISDLPTMEFSPANSPANGYEPVEPETTLPYSVQELQSPNLSLAVGYLTDSGIKRKHRPNEDSLFAMQGARISNSLPQEFGFFVVADGMGGHANGQDASRLAIQTIINYILPRISAYNQIDDDAFLNLLRDGVQCANQAVHQRNLEERADMGTTMTAALVVGALAYVANVGDSRTYLYRGPQGLVKITQDHSVVASLVEAGIIKPDDIYTHPKRNQIYRSLGEKPVVDVDSFKVSLQVGDKLLLCSDGLWDMVRDPEIQRLMSAPAQDPAKTGKDLIQAALEGGGEDNVSVIVVALFNAEALSASQASMPGVQLLYKPETVTVPDLPQM